VSECGIYAVLILSAQRLRDERSVLHTLPVPRVEQRDHRERWRSMLDSKGTVAAERRTPECLKRALLLHRHSSCSDVFHCGGNRQAGPCRSLHRVQRVETLKAGRRPPATQWLKIVSTLLYWSTEAMIRQWRRDHRSQEILEGIDGGLDQKALTPSSITSSSTEMFMARPSFLKSSFHSAVQ
jgi:hypothetical protein